MRAQRSNRVVVTGQFGLGQSRMNFPVADVVQQDSGPALSTLKLGDKMMQTLFHVCWNWPVA